jgi:Fe-S-cluster containining protein
MPVIDGASPLGFFRAQCRSFTETIAPRRHREDLVEAVAAQAFENFERNVEIQCAGLPALACGKGCEICCTLRVTATAPEILVLERYIRLTADRMKSVGVDLVERIAEADQATRGLDEPQRVKLKSLCPFIAEGICVIYPVRPLACRAHTSYDLRACIDAAEGRRSEVPVSEPHGFVRSLVQNAMQSALRDAGLAWASYELNYALQIALGDPNCREAWMEGQAVFAPALAIEISLEEMAGTFDQIKGQA